jgi:arylsulfatase A-like enzyme
MTRRKLLKTAGAASITLSLPKFAEAEAHEARRPPNILLVLVDDMGYSDLSCFGSEIKTPNLDRMAAEGLRFTQFYNTARCWPSRAALMTGYYAQQVRRDIVPGVPSGAGGTRPDWARLLPDMLRKLGYRCYHSGKWHIDGQPLKNGFDHSYSLNDHDRHFGPNLHTEDDVPLPAVKAGEEYYSSTAIASHAIKCLKEHERDHTFTPFFSFVAFTAPHFPVQAPSEDIAKYKGVYDRGWDELRDERWKRMQQLHAGGTGLSQIERDLGPPYPFPEDIKALGPDEVNRPVAWTSLSESQRRFQSQKMEIHAAMVDRMDQEVGRILDQIRAMEPDELDHTIVVFLSDNGASAEMMVRGDGHNPNVPAGAAGSFLSIGPGWSSMCNTPLRRHKTWVHEGGISTPLIIRWPAGIADKGAVRNTPAHIVDIVPTLLEAAAGRPVKPARLLGKNAPPPPGRTLTPLFTADAPAFNRTLWWQHEGNRALRQGNWKIVAAGEDAPWELYDVSSDRSETVNQSQAQSDRTAKMSAHWKAMHDQFVIHATMDLKKKPKKTTPDDDWE